MSKNLVHRSLPAVLCLAVALSFAGCGQIAKAKECNAVIDTINKNSGTIKNFNATKDLDEQAKSLDDFEKKIGEVKVTDPELKKNVDEYRKMVTDMAQVSRDLKDMKDLSKLTELQTRLTEISKTETDLVGKINGYCSRK